MRSFVFDSIALFFLLIAVQALGCSAGNTSVGSGVGSDASSSDSASQDAQTGGSWTAQLAVKNVKVETTLGTLNSASKLELTWAAPAQSVHEYRITCVPDGGGPAVEQTAPGDAISATVSHLRSSTSYAVSMLACASAACDTSSKVAAAPISTAAETWQVAGSGNGFENAQLIVSDGNTKPVVTVFGEDAPSEMEGLLQPLQ